MIRYLTAIDGDTGDIIGRVVNISRDGIMLVSGRYIEAGVVYHLRLALPAEATGCGDIAFDARSIWCKVNAQNSLFDTGFELLDVTQQDVAAIESLIEAYGSIAEAQTIRILCMEDDPDLALLLQKRLTGAGYHVDIAADGEIGLTMFRSSSYDALIVDQLMPGPDGLEVIRILSSQGPLPATVMISGKGDESAAVEAMKLGADDYVVRDVAGGYLELLPSVLEQALRRRRLQQEKLSAENALRESESRLSGILSSMHDVVFVFDTDGTLTDFYAPDGALPMPLEGLEARTISELLPEELTGAFSEAFHKARQGEVSQVEYSLASAGETEWFSAKLSPMLVGGEVAGVVAVGRNITELIEYREELRRANEQLEERVEERTRELHEAQAQLLTQQRLQQEMKLAAEIQANLLPRSVPSLSSFDVAVAASPAHSVSGDFYDFITQSEQGFCLAVADISGKGVPAALLTLTARTLLRVEARCEDPLSSILERVSASLHEDLSQAEMFITILLARLNAQAATLTLANAGHTDTLLWKYQTRSLQTLSSTGLPVGILEHTPVLDQTMTLGPGDAVIAYSDGITEAANPGEELFGLERLKTIAASHADESADDLAGAIVAAVESFREGAPVSDDLTLVVVKALPRIVPFTYPGTIEHLDKVTALVRELAVTYGDDFAYQVELAASEIVTNIVEHSYAQSSGQLRGQVALLPGRLELDLYDRGESFDFPEVTAREIDELQERGRGVEIVLQLMDEVSYRPSTPEGNHWRLVKLTGATP